MVLRCLCVVLLISAFRLSNCRPPGANKDAVASQKQFRGRLSYFDQELFEAVTKDVEDQNVVLSPIAVKIMLGMLMEGTDGKAREEIRKALRLPNDMKSAGDISRNWLTSSKGESGATLNVSSRVFIDAKHSIREKYAKTLQDHYCSNVTSINSTNPESAAAEINSWISNATRGLIPALVTADQITPDTKVLLASAVYFKAGWKIPFNETSVDCFYKIDDTCQNSTFMQRTGQFKYAEIKSLNAAALEIPYAAPGYSIMILVPNGDVHELLRDLPHEPLHRVQEVLYSQNVHVSIPKFTATYETDLRAALKQLKIKQVFSSTMNFQGIKETNDEPIGVGSIFHSTKVIVNEEGSEAAAGAGLEIRPNMQEDLDEKTFSADKPFIFFIRDTARKLTLFSGVVMEPDGLFEKISTEIVTERQMEPATTTTKERINLGTKPPPIYRTTMKSTKEVENNIVKVR